MKSLRQHQHFSLARFLAVFLALIQLCVGQNAATCTIPGTTITGIQGDATDALTGKPTCLAINREPALYTRDFGDCLGSSEMQISRFSAAYYKDNMTINFDLEGRTDLNDVTTIIYISVFAYGKSYFEYIWSPCGSSAQNICPTNNTRPFNSTLQIPLGQQDVDGIPDLAFQIPDFEGQAIMRIFSNNTQQEIACYTALISNGLTFSYPAAVGTIMGLFVIVAILASVATAVYGPNMVENRLHYAHSMSVWVIFAVLQHVFLTGALSVNWPSVLPAWWSNFAWAAGMIHTDSMQNSISTFVGNALGNTTFVGAASTGSSSDNTGGGYTKGQIFSPASQQSTQKRTVPGMFREPALVGDAYRAYDQWKGNNPLSGFSTLVKRDSDNSTFTWYGNPVTPGLPLPGNYSGFAGTLSPEVIPASNAFMTGFLWLIIALVILTASTVALKWAIEGMLKLGWIKKDRMPLFRRFWLRWTGQVVLRTCYVAFFLIMFLTMFQFSYRGAAGPMAIAGIVFVLFFVGAIGIAAWACWYRLRYGHITRTSDRLHFELVKAFPPLALTLESRRKERTTWAKSLFAVPWIRLHFTSDDPRRTDVHQDEDYIRKFGWLAARFRGNSWWFFSFWLSYDFVRAVFLGGAAGHPRTQVFALLAIEFVAFCVLIYAKPFEANRLNTLMIYLLGLSKILTTALSSAFDPIYNLGRILTTALGIIIIVIQGLLLVAMMILIVIGAVSTYISLMRNREDFRPVHWRPAQRAYLRHLTGVKIPKGKTPGRNAESNGVFDTQPTELKQGFRVDSIRRLPKIGDSHDVEAQNNDPFGSYASLSGNVSPIGGIPPVPGTYTQRTSRAFSTTSAQGSLPFGARPLRSESWSTHDFQGFAGIGDGSRDSIPRMPASIASAFHSRESLAYEQEGYMITPSRGRASTLRNATSSPVSRAASGGRNGGRTPDEYPLEVMKRRKPENTNNKPRSSALAPAPAPATKKADFQVDVGPVRSRNTSGESDEEKAAGTKGANVAGECFEMPSPPPFGSRSSRPATPTGQRLEDIPEQNKDSQATKKEHTEMQATTKP